MVMSKKIYFIFIYLLVVLLLVSCSQNEDHKKHGSLEPLKVDLQVPKSAEIGESIEIKATVKDGEELVQDAHEVLFEIWEEGKKDNSVKIHFKEHENGTYMITYKFDQKGLYHIQAHVTARSTHVMPVTQISVGGVTLEDYTNVEEDEKEHHH